MSGHPELVLLALDGAVPSRVRMLTRAGRLPHFARLAARGVWFSDCRPPFPTITPCCWASLSTGATPATHGATCQDVHLPGTPLDEVVSAYHSSAIRAERFWEAAARGGKRSLIVQLPTSGPARSDSVLQVAGAGCAALGAARPDRPTVPAGVEIPARLFRSGENRAGAAVSWGAAPGITPPSGQWQPATAASRPASVGSGRLATLHVDPEGSTAGVLPFDWSVLVDEGSAVIAEDEGSLRDRGVRVTEGSWTPTLERTFATAAGTKVTYRYRAKLLRSRGSARDLELFFTQMGDASAVSSPRDFASLVASVPGVPSNHGHTFLLHERDDGETFLEAEEQNFAWQWELLSRSWAAHAVDICAVYSVYLDSLNHRYRNVVEGLTDAPAAERERVTEVYDRAYELADSFLGRLMDACGDDTSYVVISDHGSVGYRTSIRPHDALEKAELLVYLDPPGTPKRRVDWTRTRAFPVGSCHVYVNLQGRDPSGIVAPADRGRVTQEIIRALQQGFWEPALGVSALAFAVPREQAGIVGLGGELCGDVVYGIAGGDVGGYIGGVHACQIPTALSGTGDIRSLLLMAGPRFKAGVTLERAVNLYDVAPTISYALGYPQPAQAEGAVVFQALAR